MSQSVFSQQISKNKFRNAGSRSIYQKDIIIKKPNRNYTQGTGDSLLSFQNQIQQMIHKKRQLPNPSLNPKKKKSRIKTNPHEQTKALKQEIGQLKSLIQPQRNYKTIQSKMQMILKQLQIKKQHQYSRPPYPQQPIYMPPYPQYYHPQTPSLHSMKKKPKKYIDPQQSQQEQQFYKPKSRKTFKLTQSSLGKVGRKEYIRGKLRKIFFATKKLSRARKNNLRKFWLQKFQSQINNLKNWILDAHKYSLSIILQKSNLDFSFFQFGTSKKVREQKQYMIMQLIHIGIKKLKQNSTSQKISLFSQILTQLCRRGSFTMNRFWTAQEMQQICVSQYYGFFRIDNSLQKYLIGVLVFIKPHKFDSDNFPKYKQPLSNNMKIISSVYYLLIKEILQQYLQQRRNKNIFKQGNWLSVQKQFIVQCSEPLIYGQGYPQDNQYISGLFRQKQLKSLKDIKFWEQSKQKLKQIIQKLHQQMLLKMKLMKKNLKYKLYN